MPVLRDPCPGALEHHAPPFFFMVSSLLSSLHLFNPDSCCLLRQSDPPFPALVSLPCLGSLAILKTAVLIGGD